MEQLKLKVCGMRDPQNIEDLSQLAPDFMGLIFHEPSSRYVGEVPPKGLHMLPKSIAKTGVFVRHTVGQIVQKVAAFGLQAIQLHGDQPVVFVEELRQKLPHITIIKVFRVGEGFDFSQTAGFEQLAHYFLFDTKGKDYGGNGYAFDWSVLKNYRGGTPFFLSGGIGPNDWQALEAFHHPLWQGVDINSKFELRPALKDVQQIRQFWNKP